ncbi:urea carboxylase-associated family protein [Rhizobium rhizogenes]|uniref:DUF1989 domain-containing protein n=1 Tax=Rhizobium rhizogenes TaxID=359 RepID=UPI001574DB78|nr:urea carboxylase-associated family protein [Rhizobium rhizogenes]NTI25062.1 urea carboxylase-associated family protein [Rhizobium rhizogenes]QTG07930.1 urea carboxylase-associated family protein [Rhizobium rhizogenes]
MTECSEIVPASHGRAFTMHAGQFAVITNSHGNQVVDTWAISADDPSDIMSMDHTRSVNSNIFFKQGMSAVGTSRLKMLTLVEDSAALAHDTLLCPCNSVLYRELGCEEGHRSCSGNFHEALAEKDIALSFTPASLNLFMNVPVEGDGTVERLPPASQPGDRIVLRAEMDLLLVLSACPQDITITNGAARTPKDVAVDIFDQLPSGGE